MNKSTHTVPTKLSNVHNYVAVNSLFRTSMVTSRQNVAHLGHDFIKSFSPLSYPTDIFYTPRDISPHEHFGTASSSQTLTEIQH